MLKMKKLIALSLTALMIFALMPLSVFAVESNTAEPKIWDGTIGDGLSGEGTKDKPLLISTPEELAFFAYGMNDGIPSEGLYFALGADIYLNDTSKENWQSTANVWEPINGVVSSDVEPIADYGEPTLIAPFTFDGNGHKIVGLYIPDNGDSSFSNRNGLFSETDGAIIKNIVLEDADVNGFFAGGISGWHQSGTISSCTVSGKINGTIVGGIAGANLSNIENCVNNAEINGTNIAGGIASAIDMNDSATTVKNCINKGNVTCTNRFAGGILGGISNTSKNSIIECLNVGEVSGLIVGGIVGSTMLYPDKKNIITITDSMNLGKITVADDGKGAGIVGEYVNGVIVKNCWNKGDAVLGENASFAGIAIWAPADVIAPIDDSSSNAVPCFENCYYLNTTAEEGALDFETMPEGITAVSAEDMGIHDTFEGFDFEDIWGIADGEPILQFAHEHDFTKFAHDEKFHYPACECGAKGAGEEYTLSDWEIIFDATCEGDGMRGKKCDICKVYVVSEVIDAYGCMRGDLNNNSKIDADDYISLKRVVFGMQKTENLPLPETSIYRCDVNCDSLINADDYILLKRIFFGIAELPPCD